MKFKSKFHFYFFLFCCSLAFCIALKVFGFILNHVFHLHVGYDSQDAIASYVSYAMDLKKVHR